MSQPSNQPTKLYGDLADWWHLLSPVADYAEEAAIFAQLIRGRARHAVRHVIELGSGGGNNAFHLKASFVMTLVDASPAMLAQSARINPDCEHILGDMRSARLGREFDAVFVHDAIEYMATREDLRRAVETAFVHCRRGGTAVFAPGFVRETFRASTAHGGHDAGGRGLRYLEWSHEPDPSGTTRIVNYAFLLRSPDGSVRAETDRHVLGLFGRADWEQALRAAGFEPSVVPFVHSEVEPDTHEIWIGVRP